MKNPTASTTTQPGFEQQNICSNFTHYLDRREQQKIILRALRQGPKTTSQLRELGCFQAPTRVFELRAHGYSIKTKLLTAWATDGRPHPRMALYTLNEPEDA